MTMVSAVLAMFSLVEPFSIGQVVLNLPILLQELVLAAWLIVKGFSMAGTDIRKSPAADRSVGSGAR